MSGSLVRAIGIWAATVVAGLHVYADDLVNVKKHYPSLTVKEISHDTRAVGCGKCTHSRRNGARQTHAGRLLSEKSVFRLTLATPSDRQRNGQEIADDIIRRLENAALQTWLKTAPLELTDTECDPPELFRLEGLKPLGRQNVTPDSNGEPFLYRAALSLEALRYVNVERPVEHVIERVLVEKELKHEI